MTEGQLPAHVHMIRVEHPTPIIYTFRLTGLMFWITVAQFNAKYGQYEANRRTIVRRCTALTFAALMTEPFRVNPDNDLCVNGETLGRIITLHAKRNDHPSRRFKADLFFEPYTNAKNEALEWFENKPPEWFENEALEWLKDEARLLRKILHLPS